MTTPSAMAYIVKSSAKEAGPGHGGRADRDAGGQYGKGLPSRSPSHFGSVWLEGGEPNPMGYAFFFRHGLGEKKKRDELTSPVDNQPPPPPRSVPPPPPHAWGVAPAGAVHVDGERGAGLGGAGGTEGTRGKKHGWDGSVGNNGGVEGRSENAPPGKKRNLQKTV